MNWQDLVIIVITTCLLSTIIMAVFTVIFLEKVKKNESKHLAATMDMVRFTAFNCYKETLLEKLKETSGTMFNKFDFVCIINQTNNILNRAYGLKDTKKEKGR